MNFPTDDTNLEEKYSVILEFISLQTSELDPSYLQSQNIQSETSNLFEDFLLLKDNFSTLRIKSQAELT
jgi:hypothetical protein